MEEIADYQELLVGFDAREAYLDFNVSWNEARKATFLFQREITKPLSTDVMVWDSIFHDQGTKLPDWVGPIQGLWDSLDKLRNFSSALSNQQLQSYWLIGVTRWINDDVEGRKSAYRIEPSERSQQWTCLGLDVSDECLLSGLTNCGYRDDEKEAIKRGWATKLNRYHLFASLGDAFEFKTLTENRVREHAPFFVYGLYLVEKHDFLHTSA